MANYDVYIGADFDLRLDVASDVDWSTDGWAVKADLRRLPSERDAEASFSSRLTPSTTDFGKGFIDLKLSGAVTKTIAAGVLGCDVILYNTGDNVEKFVTRLMFRFLDSYTKMS